MKYYIPIFITLHFIVIKSYSQQQHEQMQKCISEVPNTFSGLYYYPGISNVYILKDGNRALLIDIGNASVLDCLPEIGVEHVDWVLFTHHHREQCQGYPKLKDSNTRVAVPKAERALFENPTSFRKIKTSLSDPFTIYGASYVRPPVEPIRVDREFARMDTFTWHGYKIQCIATPGDSPGGMTYMINKNNRWFAFSGDVMVDGSKMHHFFDNQWDYGFGKGIRTLHNSAALIRDFQPSILLPSHGPIINEPEQQLNTYLEKLYRTEQLLKRGYDVHTYSSANQDKISKPTEIPFLWQISPHLFKFKGPEYFPNFTLILSKNGHALISDCGIVDTTLLQKTLLSMQNLYGLKKIDALIVSHIHGDHFLNAAFLKKHWNTQVWTLDNMKTIMEHPLQFDFPALIPSYGYGIEGIEVERTFKSGETFNWEEYSFTIDWMPGQTKYGLCLNGEIDGKKVAFTGDNIFADPDNPNHDGNECLVARNDAILEEGYIYAAEYLKKLQPDVLIGGHSYVMDNPAELIDRYSDWSYEMRDALKSLSPDTDYRYWFDPYWVHAEPYRIFTNQGQDGEFMLSVRNFLDKDQHHIIKIHLPIALSETDLIIEDVLTPNNIKKYPIKLPIKKDCPPGVYIIAFDITIDGKAKGELFDAMLIVEEY